MKRKVTSRVSTLAAPLFLSIGLAATAPAPAANGAASPTIAEIEASFRTFLAEYRREIKQRNQAYLSRIHPNLPAEMRDFFLDVTIDMMKYSDANDIAPQITCREYAVCKATYTQPNDSWAAQTFILHDGAGRWLDQ